MQYQKLLVGDTIIEFHNNWLGEETVIVNGHLVSKKSSIWGTDHHFTLVEQGHHARYILTTKMNAGMQVLLDLRRNGELIQEDVIVKYGSRPMKPKNKAKKMGMAKLKEYELNEAIEEFKKALDFDVNDPDIYFHMACAYSILESPKDGFECIKTAVAKGLQDKEMILNHDMLAFLRIQDAFEDFLASGFINYDKNLLDLKEDE